MMINEKRLKKNYASCAGSRMLIITYIDCRGLPIYLSEKPFHGMFIKYQGVVIMKEPSKAELE